MKKQLPASPNKAKGKVAKKKGRPSKELPVPLLADPNKPIRTLDQTTDLAAFFAFHMAAGNLTTSQSRELRNWVDLMMTSIMAQKAPEENSSSSVIHVLHSLANQPAVPTSSPTIDITPTREVLEEVLEDEDKEAV